MTRISRHALVPILLAIALSGCRSTSPGGVTILPRPERYVTDTTGALSAEDVASLEAELRDVETRGLAQMIVYITPSVPPGEVLEDLTLRSTNAWGVGRKETNDGVVIFVFLNDRKVRIELGRGLERAISNEAAGRVIAENIAPAFRRQAYREGLESAIRELTRLIENARMN